MSMQLKKSDIVEAINGGCATMDALYERLTGNAETAPEGFVKAINKAFDGNPFGPSSAEQAPAEQPVKRKRGRPANPNKPPKPPKAEKTTPYHPKSKLQRVTDLCLANAGAKVSDIAKMAVENGIASDEKKAFTLIQAVRNPSHPNNLGRTSDPNAADYHGVDSIVTLSVVTLVRQTAPKAEDAPKVEPVAEVPNPDPVPAGA